MMGLIGISVFVLGATMFAVSLGRTWGLSEVKSWCLFFIGYLTGLVYMALSGVV